jgi:two-component system nitrate/nitrite response regulator NarL
MGSRTKIRICGHRESSNSLAELSVYLFGNFTSKVSLRILLVDDHAIVTDGIGALLQNEVAYDIVAVCRNGQEALDTLRILKVDMILMDIDMPVMNGIDATKQIKREFSDIKIIILTMHDEKAMIQMLLDSGADGYLIKNSSKNELIDAIENVRAGRQHISEEAHTVLLSRDGAKSERLSGLTEREVEVLKLIAEGMSNKEVGDQLFISHRTVDTHRTNLMQKLDCHNIAGLVRIAIQEGLV